MELEARITELENRFDQMVGRVAALQCALFATAGETDLSLRETLMQDLIEETESRWMWELPAAERKAEALRALQRVAEQISHAFQRPLVRPEFRQPLPRPKD